MELEVAVRAGTPIPRKSSSPVRVLAITGHPLLLHMLKETSQSEKDGRITLTLRVCVRTRVHVQGGGEYRLMEMRDPSKAKPALEKEAESLAELWPRSRCDPEPFKMSLLSL